MPYNGELSITVKNVNNPVSSGSIDYLKVLTFDGYGKSIIEKSYPNLDPTAFAFVWLGPLIKVKFHYCL